MVLLQPGPFSASVKAALDDVMIERRFSLGQGGDAPPSEESSVLFCAAQGAFASMWPDVFERVNQGDREGVTCIDLTVRGSVTGGITWIDLEGLQIRGLDLDLGVGPEGEPWPLEEELEAQLAWLRRWVECVLPTR